ncbi:hypothetical protein MRX96_059674 [Rhipicephalus microplus]
MCRCNAAGVDSSCKLLGSGRNQLAGFRVKRTSADLQERCQRTVDLNGSLSLLSRARVSLQGSDNNENVLLVSLHSCGFLGSKQRVCVVDRTWLTFSGCRPRLR